MISYSEYQKIYKLYEALKTIQDVCKECKTCDTCPMGDVAHDCHIAGSQPHKWKLKEPEPVTRLMK